MTDANNNDGPVFYEGDSVITCAWCHQEFVLTWSERDWMRERGFALPKKCKPCRIEARRGRDLGSALGGSQ
jgi:hypothetical protein